MKEITTVFSELKHQELEDIIQVGFIDREDEIAEMVVMNRYLFLLIGGQFLKLTSVEQSSELKLELTDRLSFDFEFELDEDLTKAKVSVAEIVLTNTMADNRIVSMEACELKETKRHSVTCLALSVHLACGQEIFIDPSYYFGLNTGGQRQKEKWSENLSVTHPGFVPETVRLI